MAVSTRPIVELSTTDQQRWDAIRPDRCPRMGPEVFGQMPGATRSEHPGGP
jgi:hypothetical protein